jgi:pyruvate dehydrogenase (quinone)
MRKVMAKTVAEQFVETFAAAGVKRIYGIVGDSLNGLTDAIRRQGKIEWIHVRHEEGGVRSRRRSPSHG